MNIKHRYSLTIDQTARAALEKIGVKLDHDKHPTIIIEESDPTYEAIVEIINCFNPSDLIITSFNKSEIKNAKWLVLSPSWHYGYPMPDDDFGFRDTTYDLSNYCKVCGIGAVQKSPFQMSGEPKWGTKSILQLNWIFDEYFVKPDTFHNVFEPFGIESKPVFHYKTGKELATVRQLCIDKIADVPLDASDLISVTCESCGRKKYSPHVRGLFPAIHGNPPNTSAFKTQEIWGSGQRSFREIMICHELFTKIDSSHLKGVTFKPVTEN